MVFIAILEATVMVDARASGGKFGSVDHLDVVDGGNGVRQILLAGVE